MKKYNPNDNSVVMSRDEVRRFDSWAINELGIPGAVLMENAGRSCAELIIEKLSGVEKPMVCIFCGTGNNGGDGYVIARHLLNAGLLVRVVVCGDANKIKGDAKINYDVLRGMGQSVEILDMGSGNIGDEVAVLTAGCEVIVDAIFGTGLTGEPRGGFPSLINSINDRKIDVLAVDIPSGLDCDTGESMGCCIKASQTVTFVAVKKGFTAESASQYTGEIFVASIGIEPL